MTMEYASLVTRPTLTNNTSSPTTIIPQQSPNLTTSAVPTVEPVILFLLLYDVTV